MEKTPFCSAHFIRVENIVKTPCKAVAFLNTENMSITLLHVMDLCNTDA